MIFSQFNQADYIKYLALSIVFIFQQNLGAYELLSQKKVEKISKEDLDDKEVAIPFASSKGYLPGGMSFYNKVMSEEGNEFSIEDLKGNVVVVVFYTTWCPSCPMVLQNMDNIVEKFKEAGVSNVKIVALNIGQETVNGIKFHYKAHNIQLLDVYSSVSPKAMSKIRGVPVCLVFNKDGSPVWGHLGAAEYCSDEFVRYIKKLARE